MISCGAGKTPLLFTIDGKGRSRRTFPCSTGLLEQVVEAEKLNLVGVRIWSILASPEEGYGNPF